LATVVVEGGERKVTNPLFQFADLIQTTQNRNKYPSINAHSLQHVRVRAVYLCSHKSIVRPRVQGVAQPVPRGPRPFR
jgi:hypothetical protein